MSSAPDLTSRILRRDRVIVAAGVALLAAVAWWSTLISTDESGSMKGMGTPPFPALLLMWWLMMAAMMLPSAAPAILLYARVREQRKAEGVVAQSWVFLAGYLGIWLLFSIVAALVQGQLAGPSMALSNRTLEGAVLIAAGLYQLSPLKSACLRQCRSPAQFISGHWRPGRTGAVRLGMLHGAYCVGCCWMLMALMFVGGVMNLLWVVALTMIVAVEKLAPRGPFVARVAGAALVAWGLVRISDY